MSLTMLTSTLSLHQGMELSMQLVVIAVTTPHFQRRATSAIGSYNKLPLKYYKKRAALGLKTVVFKPLPLPEPLCKLTMSGVTQPGNLWMAGSINLPQSPFSPVSG